MVKKKKVSLKVIILLILVIPGFIIWIIEEITYDYNIVRFDNDEMYHTCPDISGQPQTILADNYDISFINEIIGYNSNVFPKTITISNEYFCWAEKCYSDGGLVYCSEIFLKCIYEENDYYTELNRLTNLLIYGNSLIKSNDLFTLPSLIATYNHKAKFQYCILDYNNLSIYYIYFRGIDKKENLVFNNDLIPYKKLKASDFPKKKIRYGFYDIYTTFT